jgi:hypothetical protein
MMPDRYKHLFFSYDQNEFAPVLPKGALGLYRRLTGKMIDSMFSAIQKDVMISHQLISRFAAWIHFETRISYTRKSCGEECGIKTKLDVYPCLPHSYWIFFSELKSTDKFRDDMVAGMGWLLGRTPNLRG